MLLRDSEHNADHIEARPRTQSGAWTFVIEQICESAADSTLLSVQELGSLLPRHHVLDNVPEILVEQKLEVVAELLAPRLKSRLGRPVL